MFESYRSELKKWNDEGLSYDRLCVDKYLIVGADNIRKWFKSNSIEKKRAVRVDSVVKKTDGKGYTYCRGVSGPAYFTRTSRRPGAI